MSTESLLGLDELVSSDGYLFLTAVTAGDTLAGVVRDSEGITTDSWVVDPHRGVLRFTQRHPLS
jgi:fructose-1,6-bisphosphatase/sedoheptulose 1,7-bisphosphatase-like protein